MIEIKEDYEIVTKLVAIIFKNRYYSVNVYLW